MIALLLVLAFAAPAERPIIDAEPVASAKSPRSPSTPLASLTSRRRPLAARPKNSRPACGRCPRQTSRWWRLPLRLRGSIRSLGLSLPIRRWLPRRRTSSAFASGGPEAQSGWTPSALSGLWTRPRRNAFRLSGWLSSDTAQRERSSVRPNTRLQRTRSSASPPHSPLTRHPLGGGIARFRS